MTDELKTQIIAVFDKWVEPGNDNRSQKKLSKKIGISDATLSNLRKSKWDNIGPGIWNKCLAWCKSTGTIKTESEDVWRYFDYTPEAETITEAIKNAHRYQRRAAIDGPTGKGKSETIKHLVNQDKTNELIHIICRRSMNPKTFCVNFAEQLGLPQISNNRYQIEIEISEKLLSMKPCVIIDEIETLSLSCWPSIKSIIDQTDDQCSFVIAGIGLSKIIHVNSIKGKDCFMQLERRFPLNSFAFLAEGIEEETMVRILNECGIKNKFAQEWFAENVFDYDALKNTVKDTLRVSRKHKVEITRDLLVHLFTPKARKNYKRSLKYAV